jgi:hypothetical protein
MHERNLTRAFGLLLLLAAIAVLTLIVIGAAIGYGDPGTYILD